MGERPLEYRLLISSRGLMDQWRVHKFGGSSVADAACMERVGRILETETSARLAVVLSACRGVTDALLGLLTAAERQIHVAAELDAVRQRHVAIAEALLDRSEAEAFVGQLDGDCRDILGILHAVHLTRSASPPIRHVVAGFGE
jgi:aspartokinase/homoserine dehydrogenase 1